MNKTREALPAGLQSGRQDGKGEKDERKIKNIEKGKKQTSCYDNNVIIIASWNRNQMELVS